MNILSLLFIQKKKQVQEARASRVLESFHRSIQRINEDITVHNRQYSSAELTGFVDYWHNEIEGVQEHLSAIECAQAHMSLQTFANRWCQKNAA